MRHPLYSQTWQLVQHGGDRTQPSQSSVSSRPYSGQGYSHKPGPCVERKTERETRQSSLAVYNRRCPCETQTTLSNTFNVTKHYTMLPIRVSCWSQAAACLFPPQQVVVGWVHSCYARIINVLT